MSSLDILIGIYVFIIGLCVGSFLNVVILRGLSGEKFVFSRSKCPKCGNQLKWYMNIPLLSYLFLRGKCAFCSCTISPQYPIVEALAGIVFLGSFLAFGLTLKMAFVCAFLSLFIVLAVCDILETVIVEAHTYVLFALGVLYSFLNLGDVNWFFSIAGGIAAFILFELLARTGTLLIGFRAFGEGDSFIALGLGAIFGFLNFLIVAFLAILIQGLSALPCLAARSWRSGDKKLFCAYLAVILGVIYIALNAFLNIVKNDTIELIIALILAIVLTLSALVIVKSIKEKADNIQQDFDFDEAKKQFSIMPFGPALIIAATLCIFLLPQIKAAVKALYSL